VPAPALDWLQRLLVHARVGTWSWEVADDVVVWGDEVARIFGVDSGEFSANYQAYLSRVHPDDRARIEGEIGGILSGAREGYELEHRIVWPDGSVRWLSCTAQCEREAGKVTRMGGTVIDVTARHDAEASVRESEATLRQLAENLQEVVWLWDVATRRNKYVSPGFTEMFGVTQVAQAADSHAWFEAVHDDDKTWVEKLVVSPEKTAPLDEIFRVRVRGTTRWIRGRTFPVHDANGHVYRVSGVMEDITAQRRTEDQLRHAQKMEAIGQFAGGVSHDFNNMLAVILAHTELAAMEPDLPEHLQESMREITDVARRGAQLTKQLLQFSRKDVLRPRAVDLTEVVRGFAAMLRRLLREDVRLSVELPDAPVPVMADPSLVDQVLMNLSVNARDAMPNGGTLTLRVNPCEVEDGGEVAPGSYVQLSVRDTGVGMSPAILNRLFEPFFTTKPPGRGTGLGLATVFGIVKQHGGTVSAESREGEGSAFHVLLPATSEATAPSREATQQVPGRRGGGELILVVEDDAGVRAATELTLQRHGYRVITARDGEMGLRVWQTRKDEVSLVVTDLVMPGRLSGRQLVEKILAESPGAKFVVTSGYSHDGFGHELGEDHFIAKPVPMNRLLDVVRRVLDQSAKS
jgi:two-component system cell cycle sensor histidine kinase/response regulator CckA